MRHHDNHFFGDPVLFRLTSQLSAPILPELAELGAYTASDEAENRARAIARHRPLLHLYNNDGLRCEEIDLHPAYHSLLTRARHSGIASSLFEENPEEQPVRHQARAMRLLLLSGVECATLQELCLTSAALELIHADKALCAEWKPLLISRIHDPLPKPYPMKQSACLSFALQDVEGMAPVQALSMDETSNSAAPIVRLHGRKAAVINPFADGFLVRALYQGKQSLLLVPRLLSNGKLNGIRTFPAFAAAPDAAYSCADIQFHASCGWHLGSVGAAEILLNHAQTQIQFDVTLMRVGIMRRALRLAVDQMRSPQESGAHPHITALQARILADSALDIAAATLLSMRLAQAFDKLSSQNHEAQLARIALPLISAWVARLGSQIYDCACLSTSPVSKNEQGNFAARMAQSLKIDCGFAQTPLQLLSQAVDSVRQDKTAIAAMMADLVAKDYTPALLQVLQLTIEDPSMAPALAEQFSYALAATLMRPLDMEIISAAFIDSRLKGHWRTSYGTLPPSFNPTFILETLLPSP